MFKAADQADTGDEDPAEKPAEETPTEEPVAPEGEEGPEGDETPAEETPAAEQPVVKTITNGEVAERATALAKAANDGTTWMQHVETATAQLTEELAKSFPPAKEEKDAEVPKSKKKGKGK